MTAQDASNLAAEALAAFARAVERLYIEAGTPTYRDLRALSGGRLSPTGVGEVIHGSRLPRYDYMITLAALLTTDGERLEEIKRLWREATALKREAAAEVRASIILDKARRAAKEETQVILQAAHEDAAKLRDEAIKSAVEEAESLLAAGRAAAEQVLEEAREESRRMTEEGRLELDALVDRRKDINTEIARVQDVLTALEAFESRPGAGAMAEDPEAVEKSPATGSPRWGRRKRAQPD